MVLAVVVSGLLTPVAAHAESGYEAAIYEACGRQGCSGDELVQVMYCESGGDPAAYNPETGDTGLLQFKPDTFYNWGGSDVWNPWEQIDIAAWAFANGYQDHWTCSWAWDGSPS